LRKKTGANPTLITPAGYVFSIWAIIYILPGVFVVYQALPSQKGKEYTGKIGWFFVLRSVLNIVWLFLWQFEYLSLSVVVMFMLLATLILIYMRLGVGKSKVAWGQRFAVHLPFSVHLGWITVASIANLAILLIFCILGDISISRRLGFVLTQSVAAAISTAAPVKKNSWGKIEEDGCG
jgi:benzodiazapine receptor